MKPVQLRLLKRETQVCEASPVEATPVCWRAWGAVEYVRKAGEVVGFRNASLDDDAILTGERLPVEFFNHEVMGYAGTVEAAASFLSAWGNPLLPLDAFPDDGGGALSFWRDLMGGALDAGYDGDVSGAMPNMGIDGLRDLLGADGENGDGLPSIARALFSDRFASVYEVNGSMSILRDSFGAILAHIDDSIQGANVRGFYDPYRAFGVRRALGLVNDLARCGRWLSFKDAALAPSAPEFAGAICAQLIGAMGDPNPWRRCVRCGRLFKYRVNHARRYAPKGDCDSFFCSARCGNAARQTRFRDNAKTPVQGINGRG